MNPSKEELFRFLSVRQPERVRHHRIASRLVRDLRANPKGSLHFALFATSDQESRLQAALAFIAGPRFIKPDSPLINTSDKVADFLRANLTSDTPFEHLLEGLWAVYPEAEDIMQSDRNAEAVNELGAAMGVLWDSFYALTVLGFDRHVSTVYLADAIRSLHILGLMWIQNKRTRSETWLGHSFDTYDLLITKAYADGRPGAPKKNDAPTDIVVPAPPPKLQTEREALEAELQSLKNYDAVLEEGRRGNLKAQAHGRRQRASAQLSRQLPPSTDEMDETVRKQLANLPAPKEFDRETADIGGYINLISQRRQAVRQRLREIRIEVANGARESMAQRPAGSAATTTQVSAVMTPLSGSDYGATLGIKLSRGSIRPPMVGDMILVEQELRAYEIGELANIENVLRGERREYTTRNLSRTSQTSSYSSENETSQSESLKTDERFQLASQSSKSAENAFSADIGVSVTGKYGPVSVTVDANASFSQSKASSQTQSQEFSRQVTEEAAKSVRQLIKESSSTTIMSELEKTARHGFNNEGGADHIAGLYRWVDKVYHARSVNYGRRLMITFDVPEPAAMLHQAFEYAEQEAQEGLEKPLPPANYRYSPTGKITTSASSSSPFFTDHTKLTAENFGPLAAIYGVTDITPPPPNKITRSKAIAYPEAATASDVTDHTDQTNELSYVAADNSLKLDPSYTIDRVGVWAPEGKVGGLDWYAETLLLATRNNKENTILVLVGTKSFYFNAKGPTADRKISTSFNTNVNISQDQLLGGAVVDTLPVTIQADFEGLLTFNVLYSATLRPDALEAWQIATWASILKGYERRKQDYEQALKIAENEAESVTAETTQVLRDSQYRIIEQTELKRGCIDILTEETAIGYGAIQFDVHGTPTYPQTNGMPGFPDIRTPRTNGAIAAFFEEAFEWPQVTYRLFPYYWSARRKWHALRAMTSPDSVFENFLTSGQAAVTVSVKPGNERAVMMYLQTGMIWTGGYLALFDTEDVLTVYDDVENGLIFDPPVQIGDGWEIRLPTSLIKLQEDAELPKFDVSFTMKANIENEDNNVQAVDESELPI